MAQALTGDSNPLGPEIVLSGDLAGASANGLELHSSNNLVHGLSIQQFSENGIHVTGNSNALSGNYIGTNATGLSALGNSLAGVSIDNGAGI